MKLQLLALCASSAAAGQTRYFRRGDPSPDLPMSDRRLQRTSVVEQVHVTGGYPDSVVVTWITNTSSTSSVQMCEADETGSRVEGGQCDSFKPVNRAYSFLLDPPYYIPDEGDCKGGSNYTNPACYYNSGVVHSASVTGLKPGQNYAYSVRE